jgi:hypothetical protein
LSATIIEGFGGMVEYLFAMVDFDLIEEWPAVSFPTWLHNKKWATSRTTE